MKLNLVFTLGVLACYSLAGCSGEAPPASPQAESSHDDHDHEHDHHGEEGHDHPETLADAVTEIAEMTDTIKAALEADDLKKADGPIHSIGHVLEELEELAGKQGLEGEKLEEVKSARDTLFEAYAGLDETIHGKEDGKTWGDVGADVEKAVSQLKALIAEPVGEDEEKASS